MALKSIVACPLEESNQQESVYARRGIILLDDNYRWKCAYPSCEVTINRGEFCADHQGGSQ
jgi:hypothetical protein